MSEEEISIHPAIWGKAFWIMLDSLVCTYPFENITNEKRESVKLLLENVLQNLPCPECRRHAEEYIQHHAIEKAVENKSTLFEWLHGLRCDTLQHQNKPPISAPDYLREIMQTFERQDLMELIPLNVETPLQTPTVTYRQFRNVQSSPRNGPAVQTRTLTRKSGGCGCGNRK